MTCKNCECYLYCANRRELRDYCMKLVPTRVSSFEELVTMFEKVLIEVCPKGK
jgi:hypothetical protein